MNPPNLPTHYIFISKYRDKNPNLFIPKISHYNAWPTQLTGCSMPFFFFSAFMLLLCCSSISRMSGCHSPVMLYFLFYSFVFILRCVFLLFTFLLLCTFLLDVPQLHSLAFLLPPCTFHLLRIFPQNFIQTAKNVFKTACPTGPQHSPVAHPKPLRPISSLPCRNEVLRGHLCPSTSLMIVASIVVISSTPCMNQVCKFVLCFHHFLLDPTLHHSQLSNYPHCLFLQWAQSLLQDLLLIPHFLHFYLCLSLSQNGFHACYHGSVVTLSTTFCECSCTSLILASTTFISRSSINSVHTCMFLLTKFHTFTLNLLDVGNCCGCHSLSSFAHLWW
jgi:hypothetical protein